MTSLPSSTSLPYHEPALNVTLSLSGFLLLLKLACYVVDQFCHAGLVAQIVLGALWGTPLGQLLPTATETTIQQLGYLGLLLLVAEGGVETRLDILRNATNLSLALLAAAVGILLPVGVSMALLPLGYGYTYLESFACGAAMSSTSLGAILTLLASVGSLDQESDPTSKRVYDGNAAGSASESAAEATQQIQVPPPSQLLNTRLGVILVGAALMDDIVGLVMSRIVQILGTSALSLTPWTIIRPVLASVLILLVTMLLSRYALSLAARKTATRFQGVTAAFVNNRMGSILAASISPGAIAICGFVATVYAFVVISHYVDSSPLIGAFCAGAMMKYTFDRFQDGLLQYGTNLETLTLVRQFSPRAALHRLASLREDFLIPLFFASIGFAIPLRRLFEGRVVWKGFIYAGVMAVSKAAAGAVVCAFDVVERVSDSASADTSLPEEIRLDDQATEQSSSVGGAIEEPICAETTLQASSVPESSRWAAPLLLGLSMLARGEIGFLIIGLAQESGLVGSSSTRDATSSSSFAGGAAEAYEVTIWALLLNTLAGPILAGFLVKAKRGTYAKAVLHGRWGLT